MGIKTFFLKKMMKAKGVPEDQIDMILTLMDRDPALFERIAKEIKEMKKRGMSEEIASARVMQKYQNELKQLAQK